MVSQTDQAWLQVAQRVEDLTIQHLPAAYANQRAGLTEFTLPSAVGDLHVKQANAALEGLANAHGGAQRIIGGPNPLTAALVSGALGGAVGYGGGWLAEKLLPSRYVDPGRLRKALGILGAGLGAGGTLYAYGRGNMSQAAQSGSGAAPPPNAPEVPLGTRTGVKGLLQSGPWGEPGWLERLKAPEALESGVNAAGNAAGAVGNWMLGGEQPRDHSPTETYYGKSSADWLTKLGSDQRIGYDDVLAQVAAEMPAAVEYAKQFTKQSYSAGGAFVPDINVDMWNRAVFNDPFASAPVKAFATGIPAGAAAQRGSRWVSASDVDGFGLKTLGSMGVGALKGGVYGKGLGWIAKRFLQLPQKAQDDLTTAGILGGALSALF